MGPGSYQPLDFVECCVWMHGKFCLIAEPALQVDAAKVYKFRAEPCHIAELFCPTLRRIGSLQCNSQCLDFVSWFVVTFA